MPGGRGAPVGSRPPTSAGQATPSLSLDGPGCLLVEQDALSAIESPQARTHITAELFEPRLAKAFTLLQKAKCFPDDLAGRAVASTGDPAADQPFQLGRERDVHGVRVLRIAITDKLGQQPSSDERRACRRSLSAERSDTPASGRRSSTDHAREPTPSAQSVSVVGRRSGLRVSASAKPRKRREPVTVEGLAVGSQHVSLLRRNRPNAGRRGARLHRDLDQGRAGPGLRVGSLRRPQKPRSPLSLNTTAAACVAAADGRGATAWRSSRRRS